MSGSMQVRTEAGAIVVSIPLKIRKRGRQGRKLMVAAGHKPARPSRHEHATILKAMGRAYRWKRMLDSAEFASISDLAGAENINHSYIRRVLRLTLLSPEITETILNGRLPGQVQLEDLLRRFPSEWRRQADQFG